MKPQTLADQFERYVTQMCEFQDKNQFLSFYISSLFL